MGNRGRRMTLGRVAGVPVYVSPTWFIVAAVITVGFADVVSEYLPDLGQWRFAVSFMFAVLLYLSVFLHEVSHALTAQAFGMPVRGITLHFMGGYTEIERESPTPGRDLLVSAAGPIVSLIIGIAAFVVAVPVDQEVVEFILFELAVANVFVGGFNLLPALPLDGGHMLRAAVWKISGDENRGTTVAARAGQVLAVLVLMLPFVLTGGSPDLLSIAFAVLIAMLLWNGASQALSVGRVRARLPELDTGTLTRRAAPVSPDLPVSEATRRAREAGVTALVVVDSAGRPTGVVSEAAVAAIPLERRPWVAVSQTARSIQDGLVLTLGLGGEDLLRKMRAAPASEYLVVDDAGAVYGVLVTADIEAVLATAR